MESNKIVDKNNFIDCYALCKIEGKEIYFKAFNDDSIKLDISESKDIFENNSLYFFKKLSKDKNILKFAKGISNIEKSNGKNIEDNITKFTCSEPYTFSGKVIEKFNNKILFLTTLKEIIILTNIGCKFDNIDENKNIEILYTRYFYRNDKNIYFKFTNISKIILLNGEIEKNQISQKVVIKFNLLDFTKDNRDIIIKDIGIETKPKNIVKFKTSEKMIYYSYDASIFEHEYFCQNIYLYDSETFNIFKIFVYKSFLNEINVFVNQKFSFAYEYLYFSLDNNLPNEIEIFRQPKDKYKSNNFHTFNSKIRKSIIFINIPPQNDLDMTYDTSFLNIFLCSKKEIKLYDSFCLSTLKMKKKEDFQYKEKIKDNIIDIYDDYVKYFENDKNIVPFYEKYMNFSKNIIDELENEINLNFHEYKYKNEEYTLKYFHSVCLWNLIYFLKENKEQISNILHYLSIYKKILSRIELNFIDKSLILLSYVLRLFEDKNNLIYPKLFFYDELDDNNPYKIAYKFQFEIIKNLKEESCLFQPFLLLDSYIMTGIHNKGYKFIKRFIPAYSISMLPLETVKKHLKSTIKNYFFILEKNEKNKRNYYSSVHKFNQLVIYNENVLLINDKNNKIWQLENIDMLDNPQLTKNLSFIINLENLHENFSHNKEEILNTKKSPTYFFTRDFKFSYVYDYETKEFGEAGNLVEAFICDAKILTEMKKTKYEMGKFLEVKYFTDKDFQKLITEFQNIYSKTNINMQINLKSFEKNNQNNKIDNSDIKKDFFENKEINIQQNEKSDKDNSILKKEGNSENNNDNDTDKIVLSKHNTIIISADTWDDLDKKIEELKNKTIVKRKDAIVNKSEVCNY